MFKKITTFIRKVFFHPFGYDLVPHKPARPVAVAPIPRPAAPVANDSVQAYVDWFGEQAVRERRFYNLGAEAQFSHPAWTKINHPSDHYGREHMDVAWDLLSGEPLPIDSGQARVIFTRYTLEHVPDNAVAHFLADAHRCLSEDGFLRIIVPDIALYYAAYRLKDASFFYRAKHDLKTFPNEDFRSNINLASFEQRFLWNFASNASILHPDDSNPKLTDEEVRGALERLELADALDFCTSHCSLEVQRRNPENHINWFNEAKLERQLKVAGFGTVYRSGYGQSHCPVLRDIRLLESRDPEVGLYMEARK